CAGGTCNAFGDCLAAGCGNGVLDPGEQCDDGANNADHNRCKANCMLNVCGDGSVYTGVEQCDDHNATSGDGCDSHCLLEVKTVIGNGTVSTDTGSTGATPSDPVQASVTSPTPGTITITIGSSTTPEPGLKMLTGTVHVDAPTGTATSPLQIT